MCKGSLKPGTDPTRRKQKKCNNIKALEAPALAMLLGLAEGWHSPLVEGLRRGLNFRPKKGLCEGLSAYSVGLVGRPV